MGVSENWGPKYSTPNSRILLMRAPEIRYPLIFGNSHVAPILNTKCTGRAGTPGAPFCGSGAGGVAGSVI